jgi:Domain of unknown function (DUF4249)
MNKHTRAMRYALALIAAVAGVGVGGCEDSGPTDFVQQYVVEGYMIVDRPIADVVVSRSQPVTDTFKIRNGIVDDAAVRIRDGERTYELQYRRSESGLGSYYYPDTTVLIQPNTVYTLEVVTKDGGTITAQTRTPGRVEWVKPPKDTVSIPAKSDQAYLNPPDSLDLGWTSVTPEYLISVRPIDTLDYGRYLNPPTEQRNRRINPDIDKFDLHDTDMSRWGFLGSAATPIVWAAFKWFGPQIVDVYAADEYMIRWFKMTQWSGNPQYNPLNGNVRGNGIGVFGSASVITKRVFVRM